MKGGDSVFDRRPGIAANDNGPKASNMDIAVRSVARLIGRQIAREDFQRRSAANDNLQEEADDDWAR